jgi:hypothetical protein
MSSAQDRPTGTAGTETTGSTETGSTEPTSTGVPGQRGAHRSTGYQEDYRDSAEHDRGDGRTIAAMGGYALAAVLMIFSGLVTFFVGITGIIKGSFFTTVPNYTFYYSVRGRGWTDLIIGAVIFAAGVCLLLGMTWARVVGVVLAVISGIANFLFLPYYPLWSIIVIAIDVFIIWALVSGGSRRRHA